LGPLWLWVLVGILLGVFAGALFPHSGAALKPLGDGFVKLIRMTLAPPSRCCLDCLLWMCCNLAKA
jgi:Na+/H+-dicarboxylate symporter